MRMYWRAHAMSVLGLITAAALSWLSVRLLPWVGLDFWQWLTLFAVTRAQFATARLDAIHRLGEVE